MKVTENTNYLTRITNRIREDETPNAGTPNSMAIRYKTNERVKWLEVHHQNFRGLMGLSDHELRNYSNQERSLGTLDSKKSLPDTLREIQIRQSKPISVMSEACQNQTSIFMRNNLEIGSKPIRDLDSIEGYRE